MARLVALSVTASGFFSSVVRAVVSRDLSFCLSLPFPSIRSTLAVVRFSMSESNFRTRFTVPMRDVFLDMYIIFG